MVGENKYMYIYVYRNKIYVLLLCNNKILSQTLCINITVTHKLFTINITKRNIIIEIKMFCNNKK